MFTSYMFSLLWYTCHLFQPGTTDHYEFTDLAVNPTVEYHPTVNSPIDDEANDFVTLISNSHIFIDKTLFIRDVLKSPHKAILITCPPRWGKSVNLHMLEYFLEIQVDERGRKITPKSETTNQQCFKFGRLSDGKKLLKPLLISKYLDLSTKYQGRHPVIYVDFSFHGTQITSLAQFQDLMRQRVSTVFKKHEYMLHIMNSVMISNAISAEERLIVGEEHEKFRMYLECKSPLDDTFVLNFLSDLLLKYFKMKSFLLIDNYDYVVNHLLLESTSEEADKIMEYYLNFITTSIRDSESLTRSVVTGVMTAAKNVSKFCLNNLVDHDFINGPLHHYHGYTVRDVGLIYDYLNITTETRVLLDSWFNGFNVNSTSAFKVINPRSLNQYLKGKQLGHICETNLTTNEPILQELLKIPEFEEAWCALLSGSNYTISVLTLKFVSKDLKSLRSMLANAKYYEDYYTRADAVSIDIALHYFLVNGYLTLSEFQYRPPYISNISLTLTVPNYEHTNKFMKYFLTYYSQRRLGIAITALTQYARDIGAIFRKFIFNDRANSEQLTDILHEYFLAIPNTIEPKQEYPTEATPTPVHIRFNKNLIRSSLLFIFVCAQSYHIHHSRLHAKGRKPDLVLTHGFNAIVIHLQYSNKPEPIDNPLNTIHTKVFQGNYFKHINTVKLVTIHVAHNRTVTVRKWIKEIRKHRTSLNATDSSQSPIPTSTLSIATT